MSISQIGIRRIAEETAEIDASYRQQFERMNRPMRSQVRAMSDEELLAKLRSLKVCIDREKLDELSRTHAAAHEVAALFTCREGFDVSNGGEDWAWFAIELLWTRWLPERPHLELLDDLIQDGYAAQQRRDAAACSLWRQAWSAVLDIMRRCGIETIAAFDERFGGTQFVFNWMQDFESELYNAGLHDKQFFRERAALCETVLERCCEDPLTVENFRRALAESQIFLGEADVGDRLFRQWLDGDPRWGWGWIGWADCYASSNVHEKDADRALQILDQGLQVAGLRNRFELLSRMERTLIAAGRGDAAAKVRRQLDQMREADDDSQVREGSRELHHRGAATRLMRSLSFGERGSASEDLDAS